MSRVKRDSPLAHLCFECDANAEHEHHVIPKSLGGTRTLWLCGNCHSKVHDADFLRMGQLRRMGVARARAAGKHLGRPRSDGPSPDAVQLLREQGLSWSVIATKLGCTMMMARRRAKELSFLQRSEPSPLLMADLYVFEET